MVSYTFDQDKYAYKILSMQLFHKCCTSEIVDLAEQSVLKLFMMDKPHCTLDEVDKFILKGLIRFQQPTKSHLDALIGDAYKQYLSSIMFVLNKHDESEFKQFCYNRYVNGLRARCVACLSSSLFRISVLCDREQAKV